ncbi:hypothetical protein NC652_003223 [Populus alba x Populus x berolinensis]|uniref:Uncharacterized protein n=1 Tax=Populus alba x Populus x berolinensis TaxID=444605 RepID=A0AAD6WIH6_9ROSI|nr:hypothetical protein NC652_003223 [Populus alba x Populus x berolinensis]KAJ7013582.1 hypothetical protein NC653_003287 [Populus alba x Populus x berolinensis]
MASETSGPQIVKSSSSRWWTEAKELRSGARLPELAPTAFDDIKHLDTTGSLLQTSMWGPWAQFPMLAQELWPWMMDPSPFERCGHACFVFFFLPPREERIGKGSNENVF